jgi:tetratricopeptide (TPR) repeat protein
MHLRKSSISIGQVFLFLALLCPAIFAQRIDQLVPIKGTPISGIVIAMSPTDVTINVRGTDQKVSVLEIKRLAYAEDPRELAAARDHILNGDWQSAMEQLKKVDAAAINRDFIKQDLDFYVAYCQAQAALRAGGDKDAASQALMAYARNASKNYHFTEAARLLGDLAVEREKYDDAARYYGFLAKTAKEANWPEFALEVAAMEARVLEAQGKFPEALARYEAIIAANVDTPEAVRQKNMAVIGKAVVFSETNQAEEGVKLIEQIVQKNDPQDSELFGRAYNAQGRCFMKLNKSTDALLAFLRVDLLFHQQPDIHAEALHHLSKLWTSSNKTDRAAAVHNVLAQRYAGSRWAKRN